MNSITFTASPMSKPDDLSLKASLAWDYYKFNAGERNWFCTETMDGSIIVAEETRNLSYAFVLPDYASFLEWLEADATDKLAEDPAEYFRACGVVPDDLLSDSVVQALLATINDPANAPDKPTASPVSAAEKPVPPVTDSAPNPKMQDYYVTFAIDGRSTFKVEASDPESAKCEAECEFQAADYGEYLEFVDTKIISVEDEQGNIVYER